MAQVKEADAATGRSILPWVTAGLVVVGGIVVATVLAGSGWDQMGIEVERELATLERGRAGLKLPVFGEPIRGGAWPLHVLARDAADIDQIDALRAEPGAADELRAEVLAAHAETVRLLLEAARCEAVERPAAAATEEPWALEALALGHLLVEASRDVSPDPDGSRAITALTAALRFARDRATGGYLVDAMVGVSISNAALEEVGRRIAADHVGSDTLRRLERFLAELDESWPTFAETFRLETAGMASSLRHDIDHGTAGSGSLPIPRLALWRHLFSMRGLAVDWWTYSRGQLALLERVEGLAWMDARAALAAHPGPGGGSALSYLTFRMEDHVAEFRLARARLRIVAGGVGFRLHDRLPALLDPLDHLPLRSSVTEISARIWSLGEDGQDDGGRGAISAEGGPDLMLELPR